LAHDLAVLPNTEHALAFADLFGPSNGSASGLTHQTLRGGVLADQPLLVVLRAATSLSGFVFL
jgi:hypothetical protein